MPPARYYPALRATQPAYTGRVLRPGELPVLVDLSWRPVLIRSERQYVHPIPTTTDDALVL